MMYYTENFVFMPIARVGTQGEIVYDRCDEEFIIKLYQDPDNADAFRPNVSPYAIQSVQELISKFPGYVFFLIYDKKKNVPAGLFYYFVLDGLSRSVETGWVLSKTYRAYGSNSLEIGYGSLEFLFNKENWRRCQIKVLDSNPYLKQGVLNAGFTQEGILRESNYKDGKYIDVYVFAVLKREYQALKEK